MRKKILFVVQRYGEDVNGGAEYHCRVLAEHLLELYDVDVVTSCARNYTPWDNFYKPGKEKINGINVIRFPVERIRNVARLQKLTAEINKGNIDKETEWIEEIGPFCPKLIKYIQLYSDGYKAVIFFSYDFYTTVIGLNTGLKNSILIPTAHDTPAIYKTIYRKMLQKPQAILYNSIEEREFLMREFNTKEKISRLTCVGIDIPELSDWSMPERFKKYDNYIIYVGRISDGKNFNQLNQYFIEYKKRKPSNLKLLVIGRCDEGIRIEYSSDIIYLGFVSEDEKARLMRNAKLLVLPSKYESLSLVILESMAVKRPVLVNEECNVLKGQCIRSNAGLYYSGYIEFEYALEYILNNDDMYKEMCENGFRFVKENYNWEDVVKNVSSLIEELND